MILRTTGVKFEENQVGEIDNPKVTVRGFELHRPPQDIRLPAWTTDNQIDDGMRASDPDQACQRIINVSAAHIYRLQRRDLRRPQIAIENYRIDHQYVRVESRPCNAMSSHCHSADQSVVDAAFCENRQNLGEQTQLGGPSATAEDTRP